MKHNFPEMRSMADLISTPLSLSFHMGMQQGFIQNDSSNFNSLIQDMHSFLTQIQSSVCVKMRLQFEDTLNIMYLGQSTRDQKDSNEQYQLYNRICNKFEIHFVTSDDML